MHRLLSAPVLLAALTGAPVAQQPNLVFIMADDLGYCDTSNRLTNLGNPSSFFETPALDRIAAEGMAFTNAYSNGPNCAPTRSALLTGQYAPRPTNNVYLVGDLNRGGSNTLLVGPPQGIDLGGGRRDDQIPGAAVTLAETLARGGYVSAHVGKYHVGGALASNTPTAQGFARNYGGGSAGAPGAYHAANGVFGPNIGPELDPFAANYTQAYVDANIKPFTRGLDPRVVDALVGTAKHVSDAMVDAALSFMDGNKARPFYLQFHPYAVHTPIGNNQARRDLLTKYQAKPPVDDDGDGPEVPSYAALIEGLDQSLARLLRYLETTDDPRRTGRKLAENTVLVFFSDNGGRQAQTYLGPLRGQKGELWEGGIRVPMVVWSRSTGLVDGGKVNHTPVAGIDFYRTFAGYAGVATAGLTLDGEDLSGIFADVRRSLRRESLFWHLPGYLVGGGRDQRPQSVIRKGRFKLYYDYETASWRLYDLAADLGEQRDVAAANPAVRDELALELRCWLADVKAPLPTFRNQTRYADGKTYPSGAPVPPPILPGDAVSRHGSDCSAAPCPACPGSLGFGGGRARLGNAAFSIDGTGLAAGSRTITAVGFGGCGQGYPVPSLCGQVYLPLAPFGPLLVHGSTTGGSAGCTGSSQVRLPIPADPGLCGLRLSAQILTVCGAGGTALTTCTTFHLLPD